MRRIQCCVLGIYSLVFCMACCCGGAPNAPGGADDKKEQAQQMSKIGDEVTFKDSTWVVVCCLRACLESFIASMKCPQMQKAFDFRQETYRLFSAQPISWSN